MAPRLIWHIQAAKDLDEIYEYLAIEKQESDRAAKLTSQLYKEIQSIIENPMLGRIIPNFEKKDLRERILRGYRIAYFVKPQEIIILTIWNSVRQIPDILSLLKQRNIQSIQRNSDSKAMQKLDSQEDWDLELPQ